MIDIEQWRQSIEDGEMFDHRDVAYLLDLIEQLLPPNEPEPPDNPDDTWAERRGER